MSISKESAYKTLRQLSLELSSLPSERSQLESYWVRFSSFVSDIGFIDAVLAENVQEHMARLLLNQKFATRNKMRSPRPSSLELGGQVLQDRRQDVLSLLNTMRKILSPESEDSVQSDKIITMHGIDVNLGCNTVAYGGTTKEYEQGKLPWRMFRRCAESGGEASIDDFRNTGDESEKVTKIRLNKAKTVVNKFWDSHENVKLLTIDGGFLILKPQQVHKE